MVEFMFLFVLCPSPAQGGRSPDLTQIKCYWGWAVAEASADPLTHIHGSRSPEPEFVIQPRVSRPEPRPLSTRQSSAPAPPPRRVLPQWRFPAQSRPAAVASSAGRPGVPTIRP